MAIEWEYDDVQRLQELVGSGDVAAAKALIDEKGQGELPDTSGRVSLSSLWNACLRSCSLPMYEMLYGLGLRWADVKRECLSQGGDVYDNLVSDCIDGNAEKGLDVVKPFVERLLDDGATCIGEVVMWDWSGYCKFIAQDIAFMSRLDVAGYPLLPEDFDPMTYGHDEYVGCWRAAMELGRGDAAALLIRRGYKLPDELADDERVKALGAIEVDEDRRPRDLADDVLAAQPTKSADDLKALGALSFGGELTDGSELVDARGVAVVPVGVAKLTEGAFSHLPSLKAIAIPATVTEIGEGALNNLKNLEMVATYTDAPADAATIERGVFSATAVTKVAGWPWVLDGIDEYRFGSCLKDVLVSEPGGGWAADKRPAVTVESGGEFSSIDGMLLDMGGKRIAYCPNENKFAEEAEILVIPEGIEEVYDKAFLGAQFSHIDFPKSLRKVGAKAFASMPLSEVTVPASIADYPPAQDWSNGDLGAFAWCEGLQRATLEEGCREVPAGMFSYCTNILEVELPSTLEKIGPEAFGDCRSLDLFVPDGCTDIAKDAFGSGPLSSARSVSLPASLPDETFAAVMGEIGCALVSRRSAGGGLELAVYALDNGDEPEADAVRDQVRDAWREGFDKGLSNLDDAWASGRLKRFYSKIRIAIARLAGPYRLADENREMYREYLERNLTKARSELDTYEGAAFLRLIGTIDGFDEVEPTLSGNGTSSTVGWRWVEETPTTISGDHELLERMYTDAEGLESSVRDAAWSSPLSYSIEGTGYMGRNARIENVRVGDELVLASNWCSEYNDPCEVEIFNSKGETLGVLSYGTVSVSTLALILPWCTATVKSVTPLSARRKNAKYALMDVEIEIDQSIVDNDAEASGKEFLLQLDAMLDLEPEQLVLLSRGNLKASDLRGNVDTSRAISELPAPTEPAAAEPGAIKFAETDLSDGEPQYLDEDGGFVGESMMWLLAEDYVFFSWGDIGWDGSKHTITGMQCNGPKIGEIPGFCANREENGMALIRLLLRMENDDQLKVDRDSIHPTIYDVIRDGDLTAITIANLAACGRAWRIMTPAAVEMNADVIPEPDEPAPGEVYTLSVDDRLARGIPNLYMLLTRFMWTMRKCCGKTEPFRIQFVTTFVLDAELRNFDGVVDGAESTPFTYIDVTEEPKVKLDLFDMLQALGGGDGDDGDDQPDPKADLVGKQLTGARADSPDAAFSIALPQGYKCVAPFDSAMGEKPYAALPEDMPDNPETAQGRAVLQYCVVPMMIDDEQWETMRQAYTPDISIAISRMANRQTELHLSVVEDRVVQGVNTKVLVTLGDLNLFGSVFNIKIEPAQYQTGDYVRIDCAGMSEADARALFEECCRIAATLEMHEPKEAEVLLNARKLLKKKASYEEFEAAFEALSDSLSKSRQFEVNSAYANFKIRNGTGTVREENFSQYGALNLWKKENSRYMQLCVDAYKAQAKMGATFEDLKSMHEYLDDFVQFFDVNREDGDEWYRKAVDAGVLYVPADVEELRTWWKANPPKKSKKEKARKATKKVVHEAEQDWKVEESKMATYVRDIKYEVDLPDFDEHMTVEAAINGSQYALAKGNEWLAQANDHCRRKDFSGSWNVLVPIVEAFGKLPFTKVGGGLTMDGLEAEPAVLVVNLLAYVKTAAPGLEIIGRLYTTKAWLGLRMVYKFTWKPYDSELEIEQMPGDDFDPNEIRKCIKGTVSAWSSADEKTSTVHAIAGKGSTSKSTATAKKNTWHPHVLDYDPKKLDKDLADDIAAALIFAGGSKTTKWLVEFIPGLEKTKAAKEQLAYLEHLDVIESTYNGWHKALTTYEDYLRAPINKEIADIKREAQYDLLIGAFVDTRGYLRVEDIKAKAEDLPGKDATRKLMYEGVKRGDLEQQGSAAAYRCALDSDARAGWKDEARERAEEREERLEELLKRRKRIKKGCAEAQRARERYDRFLDEQASREEEEAERRKNSKYEEAVSKLAVGTEKSCREAQEIFRSLGKYRDSKKRVSECGDRLNEIAEETARRKEEERIAREKREEEERIAKERREAKDRELREAYEADKRRAEEVKRLKAAKAIVAAYEQRAKVVDDTRRKRLETKGQIERLEKERDSLGLFKMGRKRGIKEEISRLEEGMPALARLADVTASDLARPGGDSGFGMADLGNRDVLLNVAKLSHEALDWLAKDAAARDTILGDEELLSCSTCAQELKKMMEGTFEFGAYQGAPIQWSLVGIEGVKAVLIASESLTLWPYSEVVDEVSWGNSSLRRRLDGEFLDTAFTHKERTRMLRKKSLGGVYIMSVDEAEEYLRSKLYHRSKGKWLLRMDGITDKLPLVDEGSCLLGNRYMGHVRVTEGDYFRPVIRMYL